MIGFTFEVLSKIQTAKLDGSLMLQLQGKLSGIMDDEPTELGMINLTVSEKLWEATQVSDLLVFGLVD